MATRENNKRSLVKAISWRVFATADTFIITFLVTGTLKWALSISFIEVLTKLALYYFHERAWNKINYGRKTQEPDYQI